MSMELTCPQCDQRLRVPRLAENQQVRCPRCRHLLGRSPLAPDGGMWQVRTDDGRDYGPVSKSDLDQWRAEGRLNQHCQVRRQEAAAWQPAASIYPGLSSAVGDATTQKTPRPRSAAAARGVPFREESGGDSGARSKILAGILGICLGQFGVHRFYLGYIGIGLLQLTLTLLTCGAAWLWGPIEGILILAGAIDRDADGRPLRD